MIRIKLRSLYTVLDTRLYFNVKVYVHNLLNYPPSVFTTLLLFNNSYIQI
jgi:hypothetical protein